MDPKQKKKRKEKEKAYLECGEAWYFRFKIAPPKLKH